MYLRIMLHAVSCQLKLGVLTLPNGDNKTALQGEYGAFQGSESYN